MPEPGTSFGPAVKVNWKASPGVSGALLLPVDSSAGVKAPLFRIGAADPTFSMVTVKAVGSGGSLPPLSHPARTRARQAPPRKCQEDARKRRTQSHGCAQKLRGENVQKGDSGPVVAPSFSHVQSLHTPPQLRHRRLRSSYARVTPSNNSITPYADCSAGSSTGKRNRKVVPSPTVLSTFRERSWSSRIVFAMARPRPAPPLSRSRLFSTR